MARRSKYSGMQFNLPLTLPTSTRVFHCYASEGKGYGFAVGPRDWPMAVRILLVNAAREVRWDDGVYRGHCAIDGSGLLPCHVPNEEEARGGADVGAMAHAAGIRHPTMTAHDTAVFISAVAL